MRTIRISTLLAGLLLILAALFASQGSPEPACGELVGQWINQSNSRLTIAEVLPSGQLKGTFVSPSGAGESSFPLIGWVNRGQPGPGSNVTVVSFAVRWEALGSITSWTGICYRNGSTPTLKTLWHLARPNSEYLWDHVLTGSDVFTPR